MAGRRQRVLITGGSGFIGASLAHARIAAGDDVHLLLRPLSNLGRLDSCRGAYTAHWADLRDPPKVRQAVRACRPEVVYHLAMYGGYPGQAERSLALETNVLGLAHLLDALDGHDYRALVNVGSCREYGPCPIPVAESQPPDPRSTYAVAKAAATLLCRAEALRGNPVVTVRIFTAYGSSAHPSTLVHYVMSCCLRGETPRVTSGGQQRDFIHVDDVVALLDAAAQCASCAGQVLHAGTGQAHTVREVVELIQSISGSRTPADYGAEPRRPAEPDVCVADIRHTTALTGWRPRLDLRRGIERAWRDMQCIAKRQSA